MRGACSATGIAQPVGRVVALSQSLYREFRQADTASAFAVEGLTLEIVGALLRSTPRPESRHPGWLERARERVHDEGSPVRCRCKWYQRTSASRLSACRERFIVPSANHSAAYQRRLRIRRACERLRDSSLSLAEIALDAGFTDQSHFTRVFKRLNGTTPAVFRREQRP